MSFQLVVPTTGYGRLTEWFGGRRMEKMKASCLRDKHKERHGRLHDILLEIGEEIQFRIQFFTLASCNNIFCSSVCVHPLPFVSVSY